MPCEMKVEKYGNRFFAVYDGDELVCVTVYKKGAHEVKRGIEELTEINNHSLVGVLLEYDFKI